MLIEIVPSTCRIGEYRRNLRRHKFRNSCAATVSRLSHKASYKLTPFFNFFINFRYLYTLLEGDTLTYRFSAKVKVL